MNTPSNKVTFASMIMTDGKETVIGVYRGRMQSRNGKQFIKFSTAEQIATVKRAGGSHVETCREIESEYSTPDYPAVAWQ